MIELRKFKQTKGQGWKKCYHAALYINGIHAADYDDDWDEDGSPHWRVIDRAAFVVFENFVDALPEVDLGDDGMMKRNNDIVMEDVLELYLLHKEIAKKCQTRTVYCLTDRNGYFEDKRPYSDTVLAGAIAQFGEGNFIIANADMSSFIKHVSPDLAYVVDRYSFTAKPAPANFTLILTRETGRTDVGVFDENMKYVGAFAIMTKHEDAIFKQIVDAANVEPEIEEMGGVYTWTIVVKHDDIPLREAISKLLGARCRTITDLIDVQS